MQLDADQKQKKKLLSLGFKSCLFSVHLRPNQSFDRKTSDNDRWFSLMQTSHRIFPVTALHQSLITDFN